MKSSITICQTPACSMKDNCHIRSPALLVNVSAPQIHLHHDAVAAVLALHAPTETVVADLIAQAKRRERRRG